MDLFSLFLEIKQESLEVIKNALIANGWKFVDFQKE